MSMTSFTKKSPEEGEEEEEEEEEVFHLEHFLLLEKECCFYGTTFNTCLGKVREDGVLRNHTEFKRIEWNCLERPKG